MKYTKDNIYGVSFEAYGRIYTIHPNDNNIAKLYTNGKFHSDWEIDKDQNSIVELLNKNTDWKAIEINYEINYKIY